MVKADRPGHVERPNEMHRTPETPIILWVCAAVCAHFMFAEGGEQVAVLHDDSKFLATMGSEVRGKIRGDDKVIEITSTDEGKAADPEEPEAPKPVATAEQKPEPPLAVSGM